LESLLSSELPDQLEVSRTSCEKILAMRRPSLSTVSLIIVKRRGGTEGSNQWGHSIRLTDGGTLFLLLSMSMANTENAVNSNETLRSELYAEVNASQETR